MVSTGCKLKQMKPGLKKDLKVPTLKTRDCGSDKQDEMFVADFGRLKVEN